MPRQVGLLRSSSRASSDNPNRTPGRTTRWSRTCTTRSVGGDRRAAPTPATDSPSIPVSRRAIDPPWNTFYSRRNGRLPQRYIFGPQEIAVLTDPLTAAIAEAEKLVATAPHIRTEQDLVEGYGYLAGGISACVHATFAYSRSHPVFVTGTGPYAKMGLDNPDTLYWGASIRDDAEYVVTGRRGTTCDLSFQVLAGNYTDAEVPGNVTAFDDRALAIADDGTFEVRFGPGPRDPERNYFPLAPGSSQLVVREVYSDW